MNTIKTISSILVGVGITSGMGAAFLGVVAGPLLACWGGGWWMFAGGGWFCGSAIFNYWLFKRA